MTSIHEYEVIRRNLSKNCRIPRQLLLSERNLRRQFPSPPVFFEFPYSFQAFRDTSLLIQNQLRDLQAPLLRMFQNSLVDISAIQNALNIFSDSISTDLMRTNTQLVEEMKSSLSSMSASFSAILSSPDTCVSSHLASDTLVENALSNSIDLLRDVESIDSSGNSTAAIAELTNLDDGPISKERLSNILIQVITIVIMIVALVHDFLPNQQLDEINKQLIRQNALLQEIADDLSSDSDNHPDYEVLNC